MHMDVYRESPMTDLHAITPERNFSVRIVDGWRLRLVLATGRPPAHMYARGGETCHESDTFDAGRRCHHSISPGR